MNDFDYDVFLSHNSKDKPAVEHLAEKLEDDAGMRVFLDKWNLVPGDPWQEELEDALGPDREGGSDAVGRYAADRAEDRAVQDFRQPLLRWRSTRRRVPGSDQCRADPH